MFRCAFVESRINCFGFLYMSMNAVCRESDLSGAAVDWREWRCFGQY